MALLERTRVEIYLPDLPTAAYQKLLEAFDTEFTHSFGGCTTNRGLEGSYLSQAGIKTPDRINLIYTDIPVALSTSFEVVAAYAGELKRAAFVALSEEAVLVVVKRFITRFENENAHNNSMDVRAKQRLCYQRFLVNSELRGGGFAPRHLSRWASSLEIVWTYTLSK